MKEPKTTKSRRRIPLPPQAIELLQQLHNAQELNKDDMGQAYDPRGFVCCWEDGKPLDPEWVGKKWRRLVESDPLIPNKVRFHDLHHAHASILLSQGLNLKIVQERLGHESIATTGDIYSHVTPGMQQQAVSILETLFVTAEIDDQHVCVANVSEIEITP